MRRFGQYVVLEDMRATVIHVDQRGSGLIKIMLASVLDAVGVALCVVGGELVAFGIALFAIAVVVCATGIMALIADVRFTIGDTTIRQEGRLIREKRELDLSEIDSILLYGKKRSRGAVKWVVIIEDQVGEAFGGEFRFDSREAASELATVIAGLVGASIDADPDTQVA